MNLPAEGSYREKLCRCLEYGRDCTIAIDRLKANGNGLWTVCNSGSVSWKTSWHNWPIRFSDSLIHDFVPLRCLRKKIKLLQDITSVTEDCYTPSLPFRKAITWSRYSVTWPASRSARHVTRPKNTATIDCLSCCHKSLETLWQEILFTNSWLTGKNWRWDWRCNAPS